MTQHIIENEFQLNMLIRRLEAKRKELPITVSIADGGKRTVNQNRLNRKWMMEIAEQNGWSAEYARAYCKLTIGVPILRAENDDFRVKYDLIIRPLPYEQKLALMMEPLDFPVTRLMTTKQQSRYMDEVYRHFSDQGFILTIPDAGTASPAKQVGGVSSSQSPTCKEIAR